MNYFRKMHHFGYLQGSTIGVRTPTFIGVRLILDMGTLTRTLIFSIKFFRAFKMFLVLIILYCAKTYCYN